MSENAGRHGNDYILGSLKSSQKWFKMFLECFCYFGSGSLTINILAYFITSPPFLWYVLETHEKRMPVEKQYTD